MGANSDKLPNSCLLLPNSSLRKSTYKLVIENGELLNQGPHSDFNKILSFLSSEKIVSEKSKDQNNIHVDNNFDEREEIVERKGIYRKRSKKETRKKW